MSETPVDFEAALAFYRKQAASPSQNWDNLCQMLARMSYGVPALYGSAFAQWEAADSKHVTTDLDKAPLGSFLQTKGSNPAGHIYIAGRPFKSGASGAWSNDLVEQGDVDKVHRSAPMAVWGHRPLGYILEINEHELDLTHGRVIPKQDKRYKAVAAAIQKMERALERATSRHDHHDARLFRRELRDLKDLYAQVRHS